MNDLLDEFDELAAGIVHEVGNFAEDTISTGSLSSRVASSDEGVVDRNKKIETDLVEIGDKVSNFRSMRGEEGTDSND